MDRLKSIQQTALGGANSNAVAPKFVDFSYNRLGQLTALSRFENTTGTGPALRTSWTYDGANRLSQLKHESTSGTAATLLNQYSYTYDLMNRITGITSTLDGPSAFTYDTNSQLRGATHTAPRAAETYQYDANGNRTGGAQQVGVNNQTLADDKYTYQYDAEGNRTRRTERSSGAIEDYSWDHRNRLTKITFRSAAGVETRSIEYRYDLLNRLVLRRLDSNGAATAGGVSDLWLAGYDGINPTLALSSLSSTAVTNRYLWGPGVDFLLADEQLTTTTAPGNTLWPLGDHLGTLRDLADFSGTTFTITNHRVFDTFGRLLSETNSSVDSHFAFTGKFFEDLGDTDPTTSLSHHWNRWYDPQLGKWVSEDPIGFAGGDANLGRYVGNFASVAIDSNGLFTDDPALGQRPNDTPGYQQWVWPWDPRADWSASSTLRLWSGKAQLYGGAVTQGAVTSGKAATNTVVSTVTLGRVEQAWPIADVDLGYDGARAAFEAANLVNPLDKLGKAGKVAGKVLSYAGDLDSAAQGVQGIMEDGLDAGDLQNLAGALPVPKGAKKRDNGTLGVVDDGPELPKPGPKTETPEIKAGRGGPYGHLDDHPSVNSGKPFTPNQKKKILAENEARNGGQILDDKTGLPLVRPQKYSEGIRPPNNEAQIDHVFPRSKGGPNTFSNAEVRSRVDNLRKGDKIE